MNILTEKLPTEFEINGEKYPINADFRVWIEVEKVLLSDIVSEEKIIKVITLCIDKTKSRKIPSHLEDILEAIVNFYTCGRTENKDKKGKPGKRIYDFEYDGDYIYAAFLTQYGIDLQQTTLHWWKFLSMFKSLTDEHRISEIMKFRSIDLADIKDKTQKSYYRKMKEYYKLPDMRTQEEKNNDLANVLSNLM